MERDPGAAGRRVVAALGEDPGSALDVLSTQVSAADLTSFMLEVMRRRAGQLSPADVLRRARTDRFVEPGIVDARALHRVIATMLDGLPHGFDVVELSPVVPLGTHSSVATVHQHRIVSGVRNVEVAADPTNALAVLAALRRPPGTRDSVARLAAVQRILRAQPFGDQGQQHFTVLGLVTAGRDRRSGEFETEALVEQLQTLRTVIGAVTSAAIEFRLTDLVDGQAAPTMNSIRAAFSADARTDVVADPTRASGRGYYRDLCFKVIARSEATETEIGDGGFTTWTAQLLGDRKERLLTSGLGLDRIVAVAAKLPAARLRR